MLANFFDFFWRTGPRIAAIFWAFDVSELLSASNEMFADKNESDINKLGYKNAIKGNLSPDKSFFSNLELQNQSGPNNTTLCKNV